MNDLRFLVVFVMFLSFAVNAETGSQINKINLDRDYYKKFREKCNNNKCCLSSLKNAQFEHSEIFENRSSSKCLDGHQVTSNKCKGSYVWCKKK